VATLGRSIVETGIEGVFERAFSIYYILREGMSSL